MHKKQLKVLKVSLAADVKKSEKARMKNVVLINLRQVMH